MCRGSGGGSQPAAWRPADLVADTDRLPTQWAQGFAAGAHDRDARAGAIMAGAHRGY